MRDLKHSKQSYESVMKRRNEIMKSSVGIDYAKFRTGALAYDYEGLLKSTGYTLDKVIDIQRQTSVGNTPLVELKNINRLIRKISQPGRGARIFLKDESANPSGSFKDRRASVSVYEAKRRGYPGVAAATSGNYGAAVASQSAKNLLRCIIVQEAFDSRGIAQPEILEKARACEAYGAEVLRLSVGPELFYVFLTVLEETGFFNASLYTPFSVLGIENLGFEIASDVKKRTGKFPEVVVVTHAGGGNVTGTARGLIKAGAHNTEVIGASVDLSGLHMASDRDFNRKSFTTGHTGFGIPFAEWPDRTDVPFNSARPLKYLDRYVTVSQGEVFYITRALAELEGMERGPAGNTSLAAGFAIARDMKSDEILVVQETEYTGAGKHPTAQLNLAKKMGIKVKRGDPAENVPGESIIIPERPEQISVRDVDLGKLRESYVTRALKNLHKQKKECKKEDIEFLMEDSRANSEMIKRIMNEIFK